MNLIDFAGRTIIKDKGVWLKIAKIDNCIGIGIVNKDGTEMESIWIQTYEKLS